MDISYTDPMGTTVRTWYEHFIGQQRRHLPVFFIYPNEVQWTRLQLDTIN